MNVKKLFVITTIICFTLSYANNNIGAGFGPAFTWAGVAFIAVGLLFIPIENSLARDLNNTSRDIGLPATAKPDRTLSTTFGVIGGIMTLGGGITWAVEFNNQKKVSWFSGKWTNPFYF